MRLADYPQRRLQVRFGVIIFLSSGDWAFLGQVSIVGGSAGRSTPGSIRGALQLHPAWPIRLQFAVESWEGLGIRAIRRPSGLPDWSRAAESNLGTSACSGWPIHSPTMTLYRDH